MYTKGPRQWGFRQFTVAPSRRIFAAALTWRAHLEPAMKLERHTGNDMPCHPETVIMHWSHRPAPAHAARLAPCPWPVAAARGATPRDLFIRAINCDAGEPRVQLDRTVLMAERGTERRRGSLQSM